MSTTPPTGSPAHVPPSQPPPDFDRLSDDHAALVAECLAGFPPPPPDPVNVLRYGSPTGITILSASRIAYPECSAEQCAVSLGQRRAILAGLDIVRDAVTFATQAEPRSGELPLLQVEDALFDVARPLDEAGLLGEGKSGSFHANERKVFDLLRMTVRPIRAGIARQKLRPLHREDGTTSEAGAGYSEAVAAENAAAAELRDEVKGLTGDPARAGAFLASVERVVRTLLGVGEPLPPPPQDGPQPRFVVLLAGRELDLSGAPLRYLLVVALWDASAGRPRPECTETDVMQELWPGDESADENLKDLRKQLNKAFERAGMPAAVKVAGGKIWLEVRSA